MPKNVESNCRPDAGACADLAHGAQLLGALPGSPVIPSAQRVVRGAAGDQAFDEFGRLLGQGDVTHVPALGLSDRERPDTGIVVGTEWQMKRRATGPLVSS